jgi:hypothetical protein
MDRGYRYACFEYAWKRADHCCECCGRHFKGERVGQHLSVVKLVDKLTPESLMILCRRCEGAFNVFRQRLYKALKAGEDGS